MCGIWVQQRDMQAAQLHGRDCHFATVSRREGYDFTQGQLMDCFEDTFTPSPPETELTGNC